MAEDKVKPVYVLFGSDAHLIGEHRRRLVALAIGDADPQVCVSILGSDAELAIVLDEVRTLPFLAPHRVVIVTEADAFISAYREKLEEYLENPSTSGTLIMIASTFPATARLYKIVQKIGQAISCSIPKGQNLSDWVRQVCRHRKKDIEPLAADLLAQWIGPDLSALESEAEKLSLYTDGRDIITQQDVAALVTATAGPDAFAITNAITASDVPGALKALAGSIARRGDEFKVLGMIGWHLRRTLAAQRALQAGKSAYEAIPWMPPEQKAAFQGYMKRRPMGKLLGDFRRMLKADLAMKSGTAADAAMQDLIIGLCK